MKYSKVLSVVMVIESSKSPESPVVQDSENVDYVSVGAADGLSKGVVLGEDDGTPNFSMRRFVLEAGEEVPRHTNEVEHVQYVLEGGYVVGIDDEETVVDEGDGVYVPPGEVHWYRNETEEDCAFICVVPNGDDTIEVVE
ncbi:MAG: cupin domain-containing protein [Halobacteria archaeon]